MRHRISELFQNSRVHWAPLRLYHSTNDSQGTARTQILAPSSLLSPESSSSDKIQREGGSIRFNGEQKLFIQKEGQEQTRAQIALYLAAAKRLKEGLTQLGFTCYGGIDSPYLWWKAPQGQSSWEFFDLLLKKCHSDLHSRKCIRRSWRGLCPPFRFHDP